MSVMRSLGRGVAHHRMRLGGYSRVNDNPKQARTDAFGRKYYSKDGSFFSHHWKDYLQKTKQAGEFGEKRWKRNGHKKLANKEV